MTTIGAASIVVGGKYRLSARRSEGWECPKCGAAWGIDLHGLNTVVTVLPDPDPGCIECASCHAIARQPEGVFAIKDEYGRYRAVPYTWLEPIPEEAQDALP